MATKRMTQLKTITVDWEGMCRVGIRSEPGPFACDLKVGQDIWLSDATHWRIDAIGTREDGIDYVPVELSNLPAAL